MSGFHDTETTSDWDKLYYSCPEAIGFYDEAVRRMLALLGPPDDGRLLDVGCGAGVHAIRAAQAGYLVDAIDFSQAAVEDGGRRAVAAGVADRIVFRQEDLRQLSLTDASYQSVFSWGVIIHIKEIERALDELARVVAPGGRLALYVTNAGALQFLPRKLKNLLGGKQALVRTALGDGFDFDWHGEKIWVWRNRVDGLIAYLEGHGLRLVERQAGEFTDYAIHFPNSGLGRALWWLNGLWPKLGLPAELAMNNLLVFEKRQG